MDDSDDKKTRSSNKQQGKWPIPAFPKPSSMSNKAGGSGGGGAAANKHSTVGSMNTGKAAELKAKQ